MTGFKGGTLVKGNDTLLSNVTLDLQGGTIKLKNGANTDLFSAQTGSINLAAAFGAGIVGTLSKFSIRNGILDGNKANQTGGTSYPLRFYGYDFLIRDVEVLNGYTGGALIDWNGGIGITAPSDQMESLIDTCKFHDNNGIGLQMGGPHDSRMTNVLSFSNGSHNFHFAPNTSGLLCSMCHGYGLPSGGTICCWLVETASFFCATNCIAEGANHPGLVLLGNLASWVGGGIMNGSTGIQLGQTAGQSPYTGQVLQSAGVTTAYIASSDSIQTVVASCTTSGINFANESSNVIQANIYQTAGSYVTGTPSTSDDFLINGTGLTADGTLGKSGGFQVVSGANIAFVFKNSSGTDIFDLDGNNKLFNLVNGTGLIVYSDNYSTNKFSINGSTGAVAGAGDWHTTGKGAFGGGVNSTIMLLLAPDADNHNALVMFPNSGTQSVPLLKVQNSSFADSFTVDQTGNVVTIASLSVGQSATAVAIAASGTIATANIGESRVAPTGNVAGIILASGTQAGQEVSVVNESAFTVTFAASGTSHVADGVSAVIAANRKMDFTWDSGTSLWYHS